MKNVRARTIAIKMTLVLLAIMLAGVLIACGKKANRDDEVRVYMSLPGAAQKAAVNKIEKAFNDELAAKNETKIRVKVYNYDQSGQMYDAINTSKETKDIPDMFFGFASDAADYIANGDKVLELSQNGFDVDYENQTIDGRGVEVSAFYDAALSQKDAGVVEKNGMYSVPMYLTAPVMYYNNDILEEAGVLTKLEDGSYVGYPTTWEELQAAGEAVTQLDWYKNADDLFGADEKYAYAPSGWMDMLQQPLIQNGSGFITQDAEGNNIADLDQGSIENIFDFVKQNVASGVTQLELKDTRTFSGTQFARGQIAMHLGSNAANSDVKLYEVEGGLTVDGKTYPELNYSVGPSIQGGIGDAATGKEKKDWTQTWNRQIILFRSNDARQKVAVEFAKFFTNTQNSTEFALANSAMTPYFDSQDTDEFKTALVEDKALKACFEQVSHDKLGYADSSILGSYPGTFQTRDDFINTLNQFAAKEGATINKEQLFATLRDAMNKTLKKYQHKN